MYGIKSHLYSVIISLSVSLIFIFPSRCLGDITLDGSLGQSGPLAGPDYLITDDMGQQAGGNLFHSFGEFNVFVNESATFTGPESIENIISRVTGGNPSFIDGRLSTTIQDANMYFLNPAGMMFGPNATLDVGGSFHVSTADYLVLGDGGRFDALQPGNSILTIAHPSAFGFFSNIPSAISIEGSFLEVPEGETLSVIGGDININNSNLYTTSGTINLVSVASPGEVNWHGMDPLVDSFQRLGTINITDTRTDMEIPVYNFNPYLLIGNIDVSGTDISESGAGNIFIRGGRFVTDRGYIFADTFGNSPGGGIDIQMSDEVTLTNSSYLSTETTGKGDAGKIDLQAGALTLTGGSQISTASTWAGKGGELSIRVKDTFSISGTDIWGNPSGLFSSASGEGDGGSISVTASAISIGAGGELSASAFSVGNGGSISIDSSALSIDEGGGIFANTFDTGNAGNITVKTGEFTAR
jgi:filamentous hemagglutinin family protein